MIKFSLFPEKPVEIGKQCVYTFEIFVLNFCFERIYLLSLFDKVVFIIKVRLIGRLCNRFKYRRNLRKFFSCKVCFRS